MNTEFFNDMKLVKWTCLECWNRPVISQKAFRDLQKMRELIARAEAAEISAKDAEYRMNHYKVFFDSVSKTPDCNTCADRHCKYRPKPGQTTRFNCPLWRGSEE